MALKQINAITLLGAIFLGGCATHSSLKQYFSARERYQNATKVAPQSPQLQDSKIALDLGKRQMDDAEYDQALRSFRLSLRLSDEAVNNALEKADTNRTPIYQGNGQLADVKSGDATSVLPKELQNIKADKLKEQRDSAAAKEKVDKRTLSATALQKYLASKKGSDAGTVKRAPEKPVVAAPVKPVEKSPEVAAPEKVEEKAPEKVAVESAKEEPKKEDPKNVKEIEAPAAPKSMQISPGKNETEEIKPSPDAKVIHSEMDKKVSPPPARPLESAAKPAAPPPPPPPVRESNKSANKRRIPGTISFFLNDPSVQPDMMPTLDQTSKFLLDNPSTTLILQGELGPTEPLTMIDARYESLRSYFVGKGVPEDQIQLDPERKRGKNAEFLLYSMEH